MVEVTYDITKTPLPMHFELAIHREPLRPLIHTSEKDMQLVEERVNAQEKYRKLLFENYLAKEGALINWTNVSNIDGNVLDMNDSSGKSLLSQIEGLSYSDTIKLLQTKNIKRDQLLPIIFVQVLRNRKIDGTNPEMLAQMLNAILEIKDRQDLDPRQKEGMVGNIVDSAVANAIANDDNANPEDVKIGLLDAAYEGDQMLKDVEKKVKKELDEDSTQNDQFKFGKKYLDRSYTQGQLGDELDDFIEDNGNKYDEEWEKKARSDISPDAPHKVDKDTLKRYRGIQLATGRLKEIQDEAMEGENAANENLHSNIDILYQHIEQEITSLISAYQDKKDKESEEDKAAAQSVNQKQPEPPVHPIMKRLRNSISDAHQHTIEISKDPGLFKKATETDKLINGDETLTLTVDPHGGISLMPTDHTGANNNEEIYIGSDVVTSGFLKLVEAQKTDGPLGWLTSVERDDLNEYVGSVRRAIGNRKSDYLNYLDEAIEKKDEGKYLTKKEKKMRSSPSSSASSSAPSYAAPTESSKGKTKNKSGTSGKSGFGLMIVKDPSELLNKLQVLIGEIRAGNNNKSIKNDIAAIADALHKFKKINKATYRSLYNLVT